MSYNAYRQEEKTESSSNTAGDSATLQTSEHSVAEDQRCPSNHFTFQNKILPTEITHIDREIPRVIHLFAHSKCLPHEMKQYMDQWTSLTNHSEILHDKEEMMGCLSLERNGTFRFIPNAMRCALYHEALLDSSRFMVLYDQGGISVDIDHVPGPGFVNGTLLDDTGDIRWQFLVEELALKSGGEDEECFTKEYHDNART